MHYFRKRQLIRERVIFTHTFKEKKYCHIKLYQFINKYAKNERTMFGENTYTQIKFTNNGIFISKKKISLRPFLFNKKKIQNKLI